MVDGLTMTEGVRSSGELTGQVTEVDGRTIEAVIPYNVVDRHGTVWLPGCFTRSLQNKLPPVLMHHDAKTVVGRVVGYRDTPAAMHLTIRLADPAAVPDARAAQSLLRDGVVDEVSFRFDVNRPLADNVTFLRDRFGGAPCYRSVRLDEVSFVAIGSVPGARVLAVRSASGYTPGAEEMRALRGYLGDRAAGLSDQAALDTYLDEQDLDLEVEAAIAKLSLRGHHHRATAGVRAAVALADATTQREAEQRAERARVGRQLAVLDATAPDPHFTEQYFGTAESWSVRPDAGMPDYPPADVLRAVVETGEMTNEQAVAAWRRAYGKTDTPRDPDAPNAQGIRSLPPQDLIDAEAQNGVHPVETIRRWRTAHGFEETG